MTTKNAHKLFQEKWKFGEIKHNGGIWSSAEPVCKRGATILSTMNWISLTFWAEIIFLHIRSKQDIRFYKGRLGVEYWITACGILQEKQQKKTFHGIQVSLKFQNQKGKHYTGPYEIERLTFVKLTLSQGHLNTAVCHTFLIIKPLQLKPPFHIFYAYLEWHVYTHILNEGTSQGMVRIPFENQP